MQNAKLFLALCLSTAVACSAALPASAADTPADKAKERKELRTMCDSALEVLYKEKPALRNQIKKAAGYGCFSNFGVTIIVGGAGGSGLVHDNKTSKDVYMNMGQASAGLDLGVKDYREVLVFHDAETLKKFVDSGWQFSSTAQATAVSSEGGGQKEKTETSEYNPIDIYPMTKTGLALGISFGGRKYWKSDTLN